jgi:hypothetical protein
MTKNEEEKQDIKENKKPHSNNKEDSKDESNLEEIIEKSSEEKKEDSKKNKKDIIPEFTESRTRNFLNFLSTNSSGTLDKRNFQNEFPERLELNLEKSTPTKFQKENSEDKENNLEYMPKKNQKTEGVYQNYENLSKIKIQKPEEIAKSWSNEFKKKVEFKNINYESNFQKNNSDNQIYIKPSGIQNPKEENTFIPKESKMEYYSHK